MFLKSYRYAHSMCINFILVEGPLLNTSNFKIFLSIIYPYRRITLSIDLPNILFAVRRDKQAVAAGSRAPQMSPRVLPAGDHPR